MAATPTRDASDFVLKVERPEGRPADLVATETTVNHDTGKKTVRVYKASMMMIESYRSAKEHGMEMPTQFEYATFFTGSVEFGKKAFRIRIDELAQHV